MRCALVVSVLISLGNLAGCHHRTVVNDTQGSGDTDSQSDSATETESESSSETESDLDTDDLVHDIALVDTLSFGDDYLYELVSSDSYVFAGVLDGSGGVHTMHLSSGGLLQKISHVQAGAAVRHLAIAGQDLYVGSSQSEGIFQTALTAYTVSDAGDLTLIGGNDVIGPIVGRASRLGGRVFGATYDTGSGPPYTGTLYAMNAYDLVETDQLELPGWGTTTHVFDGYLIVVLGEGWEGVKVYDAFDLAEAGQQADSGFTYFAAVLQDELFVSRGSRVNIVDLDELPDLTTSGEIMSPSSAVISIARKGDWIFCLTVSGMVRVYSRFDLGTPAYYLGLGAGLSSMVTVGDFLIIGGDGVATSYDISSFL